VFARPLRSPKSGDAHRSETWLLASDQYNSSKEPQVGYINGREIAPSGIERCRHCLISNGVVPHGTRFETIEKYEELAKQCEVQASFATLPAEPNYILTWPILILVRTS
jgi:hypothetical protein